MAADAAKLDKIIKEINRAADNAVAKIKKEIGAFQRSETRKAQEQAKQEIASAQFTALDRLTEQMNADISAAQKNETQALLRRRNEITAEVFAEAERRIVSFTRDGDYKAFLLSSAKKLCGVLGGDGVFYLRAEDEAYFSALREFCGEIRVDRQIRLGGIRGESAGRGLLADDTLDARLAQEKQNFYESSGLSVTL